MSVRIAVIEHEAGTDARRFGQWLEAAGAQLTVYRPYADAAPASDAVASDVAATDAVALDAPVSAAPASDVVVCGRLPEAGEFDALVALGGSMGPEDDAEHPWMPETRRLLAESAAGAYPSFAICLGGEHLSLATGGTVRERGEPQIGVGTATRRAEADGDPVLGALPGEFPVILWHGIEMTLPPEAVHLADGTASPVQAYRIGEAWGTQFHPESTGEQLRTWGTLAGMDAFPGGRSLADVVAEVTAVEEQTAAVMEPVARAFVGYVRKRAATGT